MNIQSIHALYPRGKTLSAIALSVLGIFPCITYLGIGAADKSDFVEFTLIYGAFLYLIVGVLRKRQTCLSILRLLVALYGLVLLLTGMLGVLAQEHSVFYAIVFGGYLFVFWVLFISRSARWFLRKNYA